MDASTSLSELRPGEEGEEREDYWRGVSVPTFVALAVAATSYVLFEGDRTDWRPLHVDEGWVVASSSLGSLPFGDGWAGTNEMDRTLPPLHVWVATLLGGGSLGARLASWLLGSLTLLAVGLAASHSRPRPALAGALGVLLLAFWPSALAGGRWSVPWWEMGSYGRYDMAGMMCVSLVALALARFERQPSASSAALMGLAAAFGLCAHAMALPVFVASALALVVRDRRRLTWWLLGVIVGLAPLLGWIVSGGSSSTQLLGQVAQRNVMVAGVVSPIDRWIHLLSDPGGLALVSGTVLLLFARSTRLGSMVVLTSWALMTILDPVSGANYPILLLPFVATGIATLAIGTQPIVGRLALVLAAALVCYGTLQVGVRVATAQPTPAAPTAWAARFSEDDRLLVDMKYQPLVSNRTAVIPYFVMRWAMLPEDSRTVGDRLSDWCPTWVVRGHDQWPFHLVRAEAGGPEIEAWLAQAVRSWEKAPISGFDESVEVGRVDPAVCTDRSSDHRGSR